MYNKTSNTWYNQKKENWIHPQFSVNVALALVFCVVFCTLLFFLLSFFFRPLFCLSLDLRQLVGYLFGILDLRHLVGYPFGILDLRHLVGYPFGILDLRHLVVYLFGIFKLFLYWSDMKYGTTHKTKSDIKYMVQPKERKNGVDG